MTPVYIVLTLLLISFASLASTLLLSLKKNVHELVLYLVAFAAGTMLGGSFLHLLPEAVAKMSVDRVFVTLLVSFVLFFLLEKLILCRHCSDGNNHEHPLGYLNLIGDGVHNFLDGLIVAGAFLTSPILGLTVSLAVLFHEVPHKLGDFGILLHAGFSKRKAILMSFMFSMTAVLGGLIGYLIGESAISLEAYFLPLAAGGFIYIAGSDLIPELNKETQHLKSLLQLVLFVLGLLFIYSLRLQ